jgi:predicted TIM-barrel fold metal-dependent hydrolase
MSRGPLIALLLGFLAALPAPAGQPLFDAHLHYNAEHAGQVAPARALAILEQAGIERAVVIGRPPEQALVLHELAPERIVPMLGVYRDLADKQAWVFDAALPNRVRRMLADERWRGIGELHLFAAQRRSPVFHALVRIAAEHDLPLLMHCDPSVIDTLFEIEPGARVIWAHAGAYPYPPLLRDYLERHPTLHVDLSVRDARVAPDGGLDPAWENLFLEFPDRFLVGVDTYWTGRWFETEAVAAEMRSWLAQLPDEVARAIAWDNAARLFRSR